MESISSRARTALKWTVYLRVLSQIVTWFVSIFVIRFLTPADYGIVAIAQIVFSLALQFSTAGLGDAIIRQQQLDVAFVRKILMLLIILNVTVAAIQVSSAELIASYYNEPAVKYVLYATASIFLISPWVVIASSLLAKELDFKSRSKIDFLAALSGSAVAVSMALFGMGFWSLVLANIGVVFFRAIGYTFALRRFHLPLWQFNNMLTPLKFGLTLMCTGIIFTLFMTVDIIIAGRVINSTELGYYALAMHLALIPMAKTMPLINEVAYPMYAAIQHNKTSYNSVFNYIMRIATVFSFPLFFGFAAVANELVTLVLGSNWQPAVVPLQIILLTIPLRIISNLFTPLMKALGYQTTGLIHVIFSLILIASLMYFAAPHGITAMAAAWLIATPVFFLFALYLCASRTGMLLKPIFQALMPPLVLSCVMFFSLTAFRQYVLADSDILVRLFCMVFLGVLLYAIPLKIMFNQRFTEAVRFRL